MMSIKSVAKKRERIDIRTFGRKSQKRMFKILFEPDRFIFLFLGFLSKGIGVSVYIISVFALDYFAGKNHAFSFIL